MGLSREDHGRCWMLGTGDYSRAVLSFGETRGQGRPSTNRPHAKGAGDQGVEEEGMRQHKLDLGPERSAAHRWAGEAWPCSMGQICRAVGGGSESG